MKAIIIAAGRGNRLKSLTRSKPKCMLEVNGKTILKHQIDVLRSCGINDIVIIKGYKEEKINYKNIRYYINNNYMNNDILNSLFYAKDEIRGDVIISYSDIIYEKEIIETLLRAKADISIVVDTNWERHYQDRNDHPIQEAENVLMDRDNKLLEIGKILTDKNKVHGEFIGLVKLNKRGSNIFCRNYERNKQIFWGKPFQRAKTFQKAYLTDMLQDLVCAGIDVHCVTVKNGWREIDTVEDYKNVKKGLKLT